MSGPSSLVLLIEPNDARAGYVDALRGTGLNVVAVTSCEAARHTLDTMTPRLIIARFDVATRDECLAFVAQVKGDPRTRDIPILLTSEIITGADLRRVNEMKVLGVAAAAQDSGKMMAAVRGVLAVVEGKRSA